MRILVRATLGWGLAVARPSPHQSVIDIPLPDRLLSPGDFAAYVELEARRQLRYGYAWHVNTECLVEMPSSFLMLEHCGYSLAQMGPEAYRPMESE